MFTHCVGSPLQTEHWWLPSDSSGGSHFALTALCPKTCLDHGLLIKQLISTMQQYVLPTSLAYPDQNHKSCWFSVTPSSSKHLWKLPYILGEPWTQLLILLKKLRDSPTQTVSLMSGMSLPIPAHLVLISTLQFLILWKLNTSDLLKIQLPSL